MTVRRVLTDAAPLSLLEGIFLALLESEIEMPWLELEFCPADDDPFIFPLAAELLSPSEILFFMVSLLLRLESDDEQLDGATSDIELHLRFLKPFLVVLARVAWLVFLDPEETLEPTKESWFRNADL